MFETLPVTYAEIDAIERELGELESTISQARARQAELLARLDEARVINIHGARSLQEWTAAHLDVASTTARDLVAAARRAIEPAADDDLAVTGLESGDLTFDRATATAELVASGADDQDVAASFDRDLAGVRRLAAKLRRMTRVDEREVMRRRHLSIEPTLGETAWQIGGLAPGYDGRIIAKALEHRADLLPMAPPGEHEGRSQRMLDALTAMAQDFLDGVHPADGEPVGGGSSITLFLDNDAVSTGGELGGTVASGPRVGPATIERILCGGEAAVVGLSNGRPVETTDHTKQIPPAVRAFVLQRDGCCVMDGCRSRYRLQPHHIRQRSDGGSNDPDNLVTLCWYHHHIAVHGYGKLLDPESPPMRRRFVVGQTRDPPFH
jgi:hypothetical protein